MPSNQKNRGPSNQFSLRSLFLFVGFYALTFAVASAVWGISTPYLTVGWLIFFWLVPLLVWLDPAILIRLWYVVLFLGVVVVVADPMIPKESVVRKWYDPAFAGSLGAVLVALVISLRLHGPSGSFLRDLCDAWRRATWQDRHPT